MLIDRLDMFGDRQVIDGTVYAPYCKDLESSTDWGMGGAQRYVAVIAHGPLTLGNSIDIHLMGANKPDFSDAATIVSSGPILKADFSAQRVVSMFIPPINKKYRYIAVKYIIDGGTESSYNPAEDDLCPTEPELNVDKEDVDNCLTAIITNTITSTPRYPYANQSMETA